MKERVLTIFISLLLGLALLLFFPPGLSIRCAAAVRLVTHPVQSLTDCLARMALAATTDGLADPSAVGKDTAEEKIQSLTDSLQQARLECAAWQAKDAQMKRELSLMGGVANREDPAFTLCLARVVQRDPLASYYDSLVIARGRNDGIKTGQFVVAPMSGNETPNLIGIVTEVSATSSYVCLVTNPDCAIPCHIPARNVTGLLAGAPKNNLPGVRISLPVDRLAVSHPEGAGYDNLRAGDMVYTSTLGENPQAVENLLIGKVVEMGQGDDGLPRVLLQPSADLGQLSHVLVVLKANQGRR